ncbi:MAG: PASTA domain-containing protein [Mediterranea sp.]|jgi:beta-lactam-binding protein with PASTA domain|nr:PASTA domain-containing protein [Mediterranea sp.]
MTLREFFSFRKNRFFWGNIIAMIVVVLLLVFGVLKGMDSYTRHGEAVVVPSLRNMSVAEAKQALAGRKLMGVVVDSSYVKTKPAGCVLECTPAAGQKVKEGRTIYLTINTQNVPMHAVPNVADNSSVRQAEARLLAAGFKLNEIDYIAGEKDWVYGVRYGDELLTEGQKVPIGAMLTLMVGDGSAEEQVADSLATDSDSVTEESWF